MQVGVWRDEVSLIKPMTFMNNSGKIVVPYAKYKGITPQEVLVIHDELDFPVAKLRYKFGGGEGGNNGLKSISNYFGTGDYWRLRIGIGRPISKQDVTGYVLHSPPPGEQLKYRQSIPLAFDSLEEFVWGDKENAIRLLHTTIS